MDKQILDNSLENFFLNSNIQIDFGNFFIAIILSLILAYIVKLTYIKVGRALNDKDYFSDTFIPLAIITTLVITVIKFSLALSLGLVGALSIVRFRTPIKEPEELAYIFLAIALGLALGADQREVALISVPIVLFVISLTSFLGKRKAAENGNLLLNLQINDTEEEDSLKKVFSKLGKFADEIKIQRIDQGDNQICLTGIINFNSDEDLSEFSSHLVSNFKDCRFTLLDDFTTPNE